MTPLSTNPYGIEYQQIHDKFEALKKAILEKYVGVISSIEVMWSCQWDKLKKTTLKSFIETLSLPPKFRLVPRNGKLISKSHLLHSNCSIFCRSQGWQSGHIPHIQRL